MKRNFIKSVSTCKTICVLSMISAVMAVGFQFASTAAANHCSYPIDSKVQTTVQRTVIPDEISASAAKIFPYELWKYEENGYGSWHYGPGVPVVKRLDLTPAGYKADAATTTVNLANFFTFSDIHITDEESPAQLITFGFRGGVSSAYSPVMMYTTQVLDAAIQTVNVLNKKTPIDFGLSLGDAINNDQHNELCLYKDILDGKIVTPDSGVKDDPVPGPLNDYQDTFQAAGLDKNIKWYQTIGNHDHFFMGSLKASDYVKSVYTGDTVLNMGNLISDPLGINSKGFYMGAIDGSTPNGDLLGIGMASAFAAPPKIKAADPDRYPVTEQQWMAEFLNTASKPVGHGFTQRNVDKGITSYTFEPRDKVPLKVIVLDDTQNENIGLGQLTTETYSWLVNELDKGQAENKLMIISAHIPIGVEKSGSPIGWSKDSPISESALIAKLNTYPNLILFLAGHRHISTITPFKSPDNSRPELGFWEVETPSLRDFPQEFRTFNIGVNTDNTISIKAIDVDPSVKAGSLAAKSRDYAVAAQQLFKNNIGIVPHGVNNAELIKPLSPIMQYVMKNYRIVHKNEK
jgi:metallophosphoesterase (TIGR03768 family)